jgi:S-phase kinase-associated protein 1
MAAKSVSTSSSAASASSAASSTSSSSSSSSYTIDGKAVPAKVVDIMKGVDAAKDELTLLVEERKAKKIAELAAETKEQKEAREAKEKKEEDSIGSLDINTDDITGDITLVASDKVRITIPRKHVVTCGMIMTALSMEFTAEEVPIPGVVGRILLFIAKYLGHYEGKVGDTVAKPLRSKVMKEVTNAFDAEFIDTIGESRQDLYDLILAANYLEIKALLHLGCAKVASLIKGQPLEKIKDILSAGAPTTPAAASAATATASATTTAAAPASSSSSSAPGTKQEVKESKEERPKA